MLLHNSYIKGSQLEDFNKMCILGSLCDETITFYVGFCLAGCVPGRDPQRNTTQMKVESCCKCTRLETTPHVCKMTQCTTLHHMRLSLKTPMKEKKKKITTPCNFNNKVKSTNLCIFCSSTYLHLLSQVL